MSTRRLTPRSRVEELKALRSSHKKIRPTTSKAQTSKGVSLISTLNSILNTSDITSLNSTLVVSKPSVPLIPLNKLGTFRSPRIKHVVKSGGGSSSRKSSNSDANKTTIVPKPPTQEKPREQTRRHASYLTPQQLFDKQELPIRPTDALKMFKESLTKYEQSEVLDYSEIYYLGLNAPKVETDDGPNFGFDDNKGDYRLYKNEHIAFRFEIIQLLGKGSFGQVCQCIDHKTKELVALKIIKNHKRFRYQAGVEVKLLKALKDNDKEDNKNVIKMKQAFEFRKHVCIVFELLSTNLYELLKSGNFKGLSSGLVRRIAIQVLVGLTFIKNLQIIHCDLKPENILLKQSNKSGIKIIDFGSACYEFEKVYTYIQSRFYRAPEIMLGIPYTPAIDMWSFGCILTELMTGNALLQGESEQEQLHLIMELRGLPPRHVLEVSTRRKLFFHTNGKPRALSGGEAYVPGSRNLADIFKDKVFLDLVEKCLDWDPERRITPELALGHPWITEAFKKTRRSKNLPSFNSKA